MDVSETRHLEHDGVSIAWQVFGEGPSRGDDRARRVSNVDQPWVLPGSPEFLTELAGFARVAIYDKPGIGASDPLETTPTVERRIEQLIAVMDAAGIEQPTVIGVSEGGTTACIAVAELAGRVGQLALLNAAPEDSIRAPRET